MIITESMIRELQQRVDVSYEEAEHLLKRAGGNIDIAESYARKRENSFGSKLFSEIEKMINSTLIYRLRIDKEEDVFINIPIIIFIVIFFLIGLDNTLRLGVVFVIWSLIADCTLQVNKVERKNNFSFYRTVNKDIDAEREARKEVRRTKKEDRKAEKGKSVNVKTSRDAPITEETIAVEETDIHTLDDHVENENSGEYVADSEDDDYYEVTIDK